MTNQSIRKEFLPYCKPLLGKEEENAVIQVMRSGWLTTGEKALQFEKDFAEYKGCKHAVSTSSCTAALHLALIALGVKEGDEVIVTPITWPSTVNVIIHQRAKPVFVDVEPETLNIDPDKIESAITTKTKVILPVHLAGNPCDMDKINAIAKKYSLLVVEDCAHAIEAEYKGRKTGTENIGAFSFYPTKNITCGESGMLTTNDDKIAELAKIYSFAGIDRNAWKRYGNEGYKHWEVMYPGGFKYNMPDILAVIGICQLKKIEQFWTLRKKYAEMYDKAFKEIPEINPVKVKDYIKPSYHLYIIKVDIDKLTVNRDVIMNAIQAENIGIGIHFRALHLQEGYKCYGYKRGDLPVAEYYSDRIISLPLYPAMTEDDVQDVIEAVKKVIKRFKK